MYLEHFGLEEAPFRITPHTDFFFDGAERGTTLEALQYAILHEEGIVKVSGEVGSGKTMLCRVLMERLPAEVETVYLADPSLSRDEILHTIAAELSLELADGRFTAALRELQDQLIRLYAAGRRVVILIDEAHAMPDETLEQVRLLSNLETNRHKLLQIVLFGQPELDESLARPSMRQLKDRITHAFRMRPLNAAEVATYVDFRMRAAGYRGPDVFTPRALRLIARASSGLTRRVNILADKSLLAAFSVGAHAVTPREVRRAIADSEFGSLAKPRRVLPYAATALVLGVALGLGVHWALSARAPQSAEPAAPASGAPRAAPADTPRPRRAAPKVHAAAPKAAVAAPQTTAPKPAAAPKTAPAPAKTVALAAPPTAAPAPAKPLLAPVQIRRIEAYVVGPHPLLRARVAAAQTLLEHEPDQYYSLQLYVTTNADPARMERFLARARGYVPLSQLYVIPMAGARGYRMAVVYGTYPDRAAALRAAKRLPPKYQRAFHSVPQSFAELRRGV